MEPESSSTCLQMPATFPYLEAALKVLQTAKTMSPLVQQCVPAGIE